MIKIATVCSGIGSPEQALRNIGVSHQIPFACEIDKYARQTYLSNFNPDHMYTDMTKEEWDKPEQYSDLFIGGIPCQAFSLAGKRLGEMDKRGLLFYDFYRYVKNQQPKVFIIENVKGLLSDAGGKTFQNWIQLLGKSMNQQNFLFTHEDSLMYNLHFEVLNSKDFGVPQNRERVFLIGVRNDLPNTFRFPPGFRLTKRLKDILEPKVDEKYYLSDKMLAGFENKGGDFGERFNPKSENDTANCVTARYAKMAITDNYIKEVGKLNSSQDGRVFDTSGISQCLSSGNNNSPKVLVSKEVRTEEAKAERRATGSNSFRGKEIRFQESEVMNCLQTGLTNDHLIAEVIQLNPSKESGGKQPYQHNRIYDDRGVMTTLDTDSGRKSVLTGTRIRRLTPLECFRLQGFPDEYVKPCSDSQTYKQAGNSITVNVIQGIIKNLLPIIS